MIPKETVEKILDTAQIVDVIGDFVSLKRRGANYMACCPFHNEKTPSFVVSPSKGIYKCFGCGKSGTVVGFVMEHESLSYVDALKYLARKYHIEVIEKEETAEDIAKKQKNESLLLLSEYAGKFFQDSLATKEGHAIGYNYFKSRGLEDETIRKYGLGWAPVSRNAFCEKARAAGYREEYIVETGLGIKRDDGSLVDRFFDRVIFPIHSVSGRVIAFGGRTLKTDKSVAKYVNSPETEIYVKSRSLYGIWFAKNEISRQDKCILVEGYLDVLSMHQLGITNVVASSGTSLTVEQIRLIHKFTDNVTIIYDGDGAGIKAALRGINLVLKEGLNVKVVLLPDGHDPDDFARAHTQEEVLDFIRVNEQDFIGFKTDLLLAEAGNDPLKRANLITDIADTISMIPDAVIRAMYIKTCSEKFEVDESILSERMSTTRKEMIHSEEERRRREAERQAEREATGEEAQASAAGETAEHSEEETVRQSGPESELVRKAKEKVRFNEPYLESSEKELLGFILEYGCSKLEFDRDSRFFTEGEQMTVADFIDGIMATDDAEFMNDIYRKVYDTYFDLYTEGLEQRQIQARLLNSLDEDISSVARELLIDKYQLTVKNFENSLTAISSVLVLNVPKAVMVYQRRKLEVLIRDLQQELKREGLESDRMMEILMKIDGYNKARNRLSKELGRV